MITPPNVAALLSKSSPTPAGSAPTSPEPWETWGIASRWNPTHGWHQPDDTPHPQPAGRPGPR